MVGICSISAPNRPAMRQLLAHRYGLMAGIGFAPRPGFEGCFRFLLARIFDPASGCLSGLVRVVQWCLGTRIGDRNPARSRLVRNQHASSYDECSSTAERSRGMPHISTQCPKISWRVSGRVYAARSRARPRTRPREPLRIARVEVATKRPRSVSREGSERLSLGSGPIDLSVVI